MHNDKKTAIVWVKKSANDVERIFIISGEPIRFFANISSRKPAL